MTGEPKEDWSLHPQLAADGVSLGDLPLCCVLLMRDASYPWLVLVPRRAQASEILDLSPPERATLIEEIARAGAALKSVSGCDKLNVAALGNVVPQLHVHVIARFRADPAWPRPVWGALPARRYGAAELADRCERLRAALGCG